MRHALFVHRGRKAVASTTPQTLPGALTMSPPLGRQRKVRQVRHTVRLVLVRPQDLDTRSMSNASGRDLLLFGDLGQDLRCELLSLLMRPGVVR